MEWTAPWGQNFLTGAKAGWPLVKDAEKKIHVELNNC